MTLGQRIANLRGKEALSQGDLADRLGVSRQSVSKWETDASVPELDKVMKLSEVFGVTLDELVKGEVPQRPSADRPIVCIQEKQGWEGRKIAGTILLAMAFLVVLVCTVLGGLLEGLVLASPFLLLGAVCWLCTRHTGLWCGWATYFCVVLYLHYATGISWELIWFTLHYKPEMNYLRLAFAWGMFLWMVLMVLLTLGRLGREPLELSRRGKILLAGGWAAWVLTTPWVLDRLLWGLGLRHSFVYALLDEGRFALLAALLTVCLRAYQSWKMLKNQK